VSSEKGEKNRSHLWFQAVLPGISRCHREPVANFFWDFSTRRSIAKRLRSVSASRLKVLSDKLPHARAIGVRQRNIKVSSLELEQTPTGARRNQSSCRARIFVYRTGKTVWVRSVNFLLICTTSLKVSHEWGECVSWSEEILKMKNSTAGSSDEVVERESLDVEVDPAPR
jgi:hypothetical protein